MDTSSGHSDIKIKAVCVLKLYIHCFSWLLQKHSLGNIVCYFGRSNNTNTTSCTVHRYNSLDSLEMVQEKLISVVSQYEIKLVNDN